MTRAVKSMAQRRKQAPPPPQRSPWLERGVFGLAAIAVVVVGVGLSLINRDRTTSATDAGPVHVHGLGVNPADGALFIAAHTGLFRSDAGESTSARVGDSYQDTMGFTVVDENSFLGSGHPDLRKDLPPLLGLIESTDRGRSWRSISLLGEADFHVLRSAGEVVYGYDASNDRLMVSTDAGRRWEEVERPAPLVDLAADPKDSRHVVASGVSDVSQGLYESRDGGRSWKQKGNQVGLLAWPVTGQLFLVDGGGDVSLSTDGGNTFERRGAIGGQPAALLGQGDEELFIALHDGTIKRSANGGSTWTIRSTP